MHVVSEMVTLTLPAYYNSMITVNISQQGYSMLAAVYIVRSGTKKKEGRKDTKFLRILSDLPTYPHIRKKKDVGIFHAM